MTIDRSQLRNLPAVDEVLRRPALVSLLEKAPRWAVTEAVRREIDAVRRAVLQGENIERLDVESVAVEQRVCELLEPAICEVINATGVVVHTNLGRAPLSEHALERLLSVARGYSNLEYELDEGRRGSRHAHLRRIASEVCGAEDAVIVNNNAAAVLLTISAISAGREVIVSRGELVEIGGGFRIPDVIVQGGARLREVGTTNRTRVRDYEAAITEETGALLKVHRSNFGVVGFTEEASIASLAELARAKGLPLVEDLGSGAMVESYGPGLSGEAIARRSLEDGADLVCFSGDKLFGGPQAGIILGSAPLIATIRSHPLMRALRPCKLTLSALEATFELWRDDREMEIPVRSMLSVEAEVSRRRVKRVRRRLAKTSSDWILGEQAVEGRSGGGSMPLKTAQGWAIALRHRLASVEKVERTLRMGTPPVIGRIVDDWLLLDLRTVGQSQERQLVDRVAEVAATLGKA